MNLPTNIVIKQEKVGLVFEAAEELENYPQLNFCVNVKMEEQEPEEENDWCSETKDFIENSNKNNEAIFYDKLREFCYQKCSMCDTLFPNRYSIIQHNLSHIIIPLEIPNLYQCDYCLIYCTKKAEIIKHIKKVHNVYGIVNNRSKSLHQCNICLKIYTYKNWHSHMSGVHGTGKYKCTKCNEIFKCQRYLNRHKLYTHNGGIRSCRLESFMKQFKCKECDKVFKCSDSLYQHKKNCHSNQAAVCKICNSQLKSQSYLNTHMRRVHYNDGKMHKCDICNKQFKSPRYLSIHKKNSHTDSSRTVRTKWFACNICKRNYKTEKKLEAHSKKCQVLIKNETKIEIEEIKLEPSCGAIP